MSSPADDTSTVEVKNKNTWNTFIKKKKKQASVCWSYHKNAPAGCSQLRFCFSEGEEKLQNKAQWLGFENCPQHK